MNFLNFETNLEMINLKRNEGNETKKLFVNQNISFPTILNDGTMINFGAHLNGGIFILKNIIIQKLENLNIVNSNPTSILNFLLN